jgi:addiction module HigA family antidote
MTHMFSFEGNTTPPSPGEVIRKRLLDELHLTQAELARAIDISRPRLNMIMRGRCQLSAEIALRIEKVFDISPHYWLRIRDEFELYLERQRFSGTLNNLRPLSTPREDETSAWRVREFQAAA